MARPTSRRSAPLPRNWNRVRARILRRDPDCTLRINCCGAPSTEVDHIGAPGDHGDENLRGVCRSCHATRTGQQGAAVTNAKRLSRKRPPEPHPGILRR